jgi:hypothetical protein
MSNTMIQAALAWRLAWFKAISGILIVGLTAANAGISGADICTPHTAKVILFWTSIFILTIKSLDMFMDQTINNLKKFSNPLGLETGDTAVITKQTDTTQVTTVKA